MSRSTSDSEDGMLSNNQVDSPLMDESNGGIGNGGIVLKKGPWTSAEDAILVEYVKKHGEGNWNAVQKHSGLFRCGKSCRLRWANHLRPNLKKGAFTSEEECLIVELHAKMGNKWARMAAHLPGRTDNEIKNYWNTRIKRRQRAGLPLYPPELSLQESQQGYSSGAPNDTDRAHHDPHQSNDYEIPDVEFDSLKDSCGLPYGPELPDIPASCILMNDISSSPCCGLMPPTMHRQKRLRESTAFVPTGFRDGYAQFDQYENDACDKVAQPFGLSFPPDPTTKSSLNFGVNQGSHALENGNSSACRPTCGTAKLELPSFQYPETDFGSWRTFPPASLLESDNLIQSPPPVGPYESDCASPRNSGLLEALLYESKTLGSMKNHSTDKSSNSSSFTPEEVGNSSTLNVCEREWEEQGDPTSPLVLSATSLFSEYTPISASGSSLEEAPPAETLNGSDVKPEPADPSWIPEKQRESSPPLEYTRPDALLGSDWFEHTDQVNAIASLIGEDLVTDYKHLASEGTSSSQGWGHGSCPWNNMPAVCQMTDLP